MVFNCLGETTADIGEVQMEKKLERRKLFHAVEDILPDSLMAHSTLRLLECTKMTTLYRLH